MDARANQGMNTPISMERVLAALGLVSLLVLTATWAALPWHWGSVGLYFLVSAGIEIARRLRGREISTMIPVAVIVVANMIDSRFLRAQTQGLAQSAHQLASVVLFMVLGSLLVRLLIKPRAQ